MEYYYDSFQKLVDTNENFIKSVQTYGDYELTSFNYRLASYSDFLLPNALEARGKTFIKDKSGQIDLFCTNFEKFFNVYENPFTEEKVVAKLTPKSVTEKVDGSLITVGMLPTGEILAKTKSTIDSEQAKRATHIINSDKLKYSFCESWINQDYTPMFEYVAPTNQIVLFYPEEKLVLLALRNMLTGDYYPIHELEDCPFEIVKEYNLTLKEIAELQENASGREGLVITFDNGQRIKFKTLDYVKKHRCKDSISNKKHLSELILSNGLDDILPLFKEDKDLLKYLEEFRTKLIVLYNNLIQEIDDFYLENKDLERKDYAIKATTELKNKMSLAMNLYVGRESGVIDFLIKNKLYELI